MSTMTQPRISLDAPAPRPPAYGLTGSPGAATVPDGGRWEAGSWVERYPETLPSSHDPCTDGSEDVKDDPDAFELGNPFPTKTVYLGEICTSKNVAGVWNAWKERANVALEARTSWALERMLAWAFYGVEDDPQAWLADADADYPAGISGVPVRNAMAWAEAYLAQLGQEGVIHVPPPVATALGSDFFRVSGTTLYTAAGTPVIVGTGYYADPVENLSPSDQASPDAQEAPSGSSWIFTSGPVLYRTGPIYALPETIGEALDRDDNSVVYRAERDLWVGFDGGRHAAILADWTP